VALTLAGLGFAPVTDSLAASSPEALAQAYAHGRDAILTGLYLGGLAWSGVFLVFVAALCLVGGAIDAAVRLGGFSPALRRIGSPLWLVGVSVWVALHQLASAAAMAREGFWSPGGPVGTTAPLGMTLWVGCLAALAWRRSRR